MAVPFLILGAAGVAAALGIGTGANAVRKNSKAKKINKSAQELFDEAKTAAEKARDRSGKKLEKLGKTKLEVLDGSVNRFVNVFERIHNIELSDSVGLDELGKFRLDKQSVMQMREMGQMATSVIGGLVGGAGAGALTAFGAYGLTMTFAAASTGTAIASLSGVAATNATLAFLGGGALAAGGYGMAMGTAVLGGAVAGPAIAILGIVMNASASKNLDKARSNKAEAEELAEELKTVKSICNAISKRSDMFISLLKKLNEIFAHFITELENIVETSGCDYSSYTEEEQNTVAMAMSVACAIKKVLDTPILTEEGKITDESKATHKEMTKYLEDTKTALA